jgi:SAM-dependent methyltransferase
MGAKFPSSNLCSRGLRRLLARIGAARPAPARCAADWDREYESGRWDVFDGLPELSRHSVLAGYAGYLKPGGSILDVGCGTGALHRQLQPHRYSRYLGIDISGAAIARLQTRADVTTRFIVADASTYRPVDRFDVIVFSEVLDYLPDGAIEHYRGALASGGIFLVSTCTAYERAAALIAGLGRRYPVVDETCVTRSGADFSWVVTVLAPERVPS